MRIYFTLKHRMNKILKNCKSNLTALSQKLPTHVFPIGEIQIALKKKWLFGCQWHFTLEAYFVVTIHVCLHRHICYNCDSNAGHAEYSVVAFKCNGYGFEF